MAMHENGNGQVTAPAADKNALTALLDQYKNGLANLRLQREELETRLESTTVQMHQQEGAIAAMQQLIDSLEAESKQALPELG
jgi:chromosome segregation ATPase